jgi:TctA family transporter
MLEGLALITPMVMLYVVLGVVITTVVVIIPGLGGMFALAILLPFVFRMDPVTGIAFLMAMNVVNGTGNTITSVLFGIPGSASGVASTFDGFPMTQRGEGIRAVSAGLTASTLGGIIGAIVLALSLPILRPIVLAFRSPEFFTLIVAAIIFMAFIGGGDPVRSLISGGLGLLLAFVGMEISTGTQRYTFGQLYLWDGLPLIPMLLGLYAVSEMISLMNRGGAIAQRRSGERASQQLLAGIRDNFTHWKAVLQSSTAGLWVGLAPGLGDAAAQFVGYSQVARTSRNRDQFGKGAVEGVIAADAATNSKEGGALIPTLAFGIPGSSSMAIIIAAFLAFGIQPGPEMLTTNVSIVWMIIFIMVIANVLAAALCMGITPLMAKVTSLRASLIVAPILIFSVFGAYSTNYNFLDIIILFVFGIVGYLLKEFGYSRPIFLIGFVLGEVMEQHYLLSRRIYGFAFFQRPIVILLIVALTVMIAGPYVKNMLRGLRRGSAPVAPVTAVAPEETGTATTGPTEQR